ncbi:MAG: PilZ domain-containing protein [Planctomycetota bacterium]
MQINTSALSLARIDHLQEDAPGEGGPLRFERRRAPRYATAGTATAQVVGSGGNALAGVRLVDSSACGLAVMTEAQVAPGDEVRVFFAGDPLPGRVGVARRIDPVMTAEGLSYRVGIDCGTLTAA